MAVNESTLAALKHAIGTLNDRQSALIDPELVASLDGLAQTGQRIRIDLEASRTLGAPLITVADRATASGDFDVLTARQKEVALLVLEGLSNKAIASRLGLSLATVKDHVHAVLTRLDMPSRAALIAVFRS